MGDGAVDETDSSGVFVEEFEVSAIGYFLILLYLEYEPISYNDMSKSFIQFLYLRLVRKIIRTIVFDKKNDDLSDLFCGMQFTLGKTESSQHATQAKNFEMNVQLFNQCIINLKSIDFH